MVHRAIPKAKQPEAGERREARSTTEICKPPPQKNEWAAVGLQSEGVFGLVNATWGALSCTKPRF